ncbi:hypothetical protein A2U01_0116638, partial [Trifolium medium]|nr:hypothetical protein [Trifolium medium]
MWTCLISWSDAALDHSQGISMWDDNFIDRRWKVESG